MLSTFDSRRSTFDFPYGTTCSTESLGKLSPASFTAVTRTRTAAPGANVFRFALVRNWFVDLKKPATGVSDPMFFQGRGGDSGT